MKYIIGADEVGYGPIAGPVMVGAVMAPFDMERPEGVTDSKKMTEAARQRVHERLRGLDNVHRAVAYRHASFIDEHGVGPALAASFEEAIGKLLDLGHEVVGVRIDGEDKGFDTRGVPTEYILKGDLHDWYIGAASIVAKTVRDGIMGRWDTEDAYRGYGWAQNKGYGTKAHTNAIRQLGLSEQHRKSYCRRCETPDTCEGVLEMFK